MIEQRGAACMNMPRRKQLAHEYGDGVAACISIVSALTRRSIECFQYFITADPPRPALPRYAITRWRFGFIEKDIQ